MTPMPLVVGALVALATTGTYLTLIPADAVPIPPPAVAPEAEPEPASPAPPADGRGILRWRIEHTGAAVLTLLYVTEELAGESVPVWQDVVELEPGIYAKDLSLDVGSYRVAFWNTGASASGPVDLSECASRDVTQPMASKGDPLFGGASIERPICLGEA